MAEKAYTAGEIIQQILPAKPFADHLEHSTCFAPSNIALIKYWGKANQHLNLPNTSSLSVTLPNKGTRTSIKINPKLKQDHIVFNNKLLPTEHKITQRMSDYLNLFRQDRAIYFEINTDNNIPTGAGLASSASGFAALAMGLNALFNWQLSSEQLSILARMGSGSACRSFWPGFVEWQKGTRTDGLDSFAHPIFAQQPWHQLRLGLLIHSEQEKPIGSTAAMIQTVKTSRLYAAWPTRVEQDLENIKTAIKHKDFTALGEITEQNSIAMHETMLTSEPSINYANTETQIGKQKVWQLRKDHIPVYFTQDAGPNLKLLFLEQHETAIKTVFPDLETVELF